jgi:hypothetical protein
MASARFRNRQSRHRISVWRACFSKLFFIVDEDNTWPFSRAKAAQGMLAMKLAEDCFFGAIAEHEDKSVFNVNV